MFCREDLVFRAVGLTSQYRRDDLDVSHDVDDVDYDTRSVHTHWMMNLTNSIPLTSVAKCIRPLVTLLFLLFWTSGTAIADQLRIEAVPGIPFGVGRIVIPKSQSIEKEIFLG